MKIQFVPLEAKIFGLTDYPVTKHFKNQAEQIELFAELNQCYKKFNDEYLSSKKAKAYFSFLVKYPRTADMLSLILTFFRSEKAVPKLDKAVEENTETTVKTLLFLASFPYSVKQRDAAVGDMLESYEKNKELLGSKRAKHILRRDVACSYTPLLKQLTSSRLFRIIKWAGIYALFSYLWGLK